MKCRGPMSSTRLWREARKLHRRLPVRGLKAKHVFEAGSEDLEIASGAAKIKLQKDGTIEITGTHIKLQAGAGLIEIDPAGIISIKGPMVKINT